MWRDYFSVTSIEEALQLLCERGSRARLIAGGTDLLLEIERGVRTEIDTLIDVSRIPGLDRINKDQQGNIHLGPLVTHNHCIASQLITIQAFPLAQACWEVGAPQIRNRGTVAGNLITASPANDTITPLMALGASVTLQSTSGKRLVALKDFFTGVRGTVMRPEEMLVDISFPAMKSHQKGMFIKLGLRRAQAISLVNAAVVVEFDQTYSSEPGRINNAEITLGAVAPTIIFAEEAQDYLKGKQLGEQEIEQAAQMAEAAARPIDDVRSSGDYRREMVRVCVLRALRSLVTGEQAAGFPTNPVLLWGSQYSGEAPRMERAVHHVADTPILTRINGRLFTSREGHNKTLLRFLRENALLTGTKEGCAEGECGACTVFLDGVAVMSCLVPAARAHGAEIVTIEGLAQDGYLHPVQETFIEEGAVQCGYCTPGFIMSAAKLLEERPHPTVGEIHQAITGNLCRCTGYYKIVAAIERASQVEVISE
jgi:xanthine dehydrogenase iron-sulfur cluster and FAD-binding subunit A